LAMKKIKIETPLAPGHMENHVHTFAQGWRVGDLVFTGGIAAEDPVTGKLVSGGIEEQARRCFETLKAILEAGGSKMSNVIKITVFFAKFEDKAAFEKIYGEYFPKDRPGRTSCAVSYLGHGTLLEIDAVAVVD
jgi:2-iminobutanoate/2-iminopropanoate deaminase